MKSVGFVVADCINKIMQQSQSLDEGMMTALRVLESAIEREQPNPADIEELRRLAPLQGDLPIDDLACVVIQQAVQAAEEREPRKRG